jgi:hypothetical protein
MSIILVLFVITLAHIANSSLTQGLVFISPSLMLVNVIVGGIQAIALQSLVSYISYANGIENYGGPLLVVIFVDIINVIVWSNRRTSYYAASIIGLSIGYYLKFSGVI